VEVCRGVYWKHPFVKHWEYCWEQKFSLPSFQKD
jgi:hypothetical protein